MYEETWDPLMILMTLPLRNLSPLYLALLVYRMGVVPQREDL